MENQPIVVEAVLDAPVAKVWKALSDNDEMRNWHFQLPDFKAEKGFKFQFSGGPSPEKQYLHLCEVTEAVPEKKLGYSWRYDGYPGNSFVVFELSDKEGKTLVKLTHSGLESFPEDNPDLAAKNFEEGWNAIINSSLKNYVEKE